jgi:hypothetical protein
VRARFSGLVAACAWLTVMPAAQAAEAIASRPAAAPFDHYQHWRDDPLQDWRKANDHVGEIGGWRTYLRESQQTGEHPDQSGHDHHAH